MREALRTRTQKAQEEIAIAHAKYVKEQEALRCAEAAKRAREADAAIRETHDEIILGLDAAADCGHFAYIHYLNDNAIKYLDIVVNKITEIFRELEPQFDSNVYRDGLPGDIDADYSITFSWD